MKGLSSFNLDYNLLLPLTALGKNRHLSFQPTGRYSVVNITAGHTEMTHIEARCPIEELYYVAHARLTGLGKITGESLDHKQYYVLPGERVPCLKYLHPHTYHAHTTQSAIPKYQVTYPQNELEGFFLHDRPKELAASVSDSRPEQGGDLLLVLVHDQQLCHCSVSNRAS